MQITKHSQIKIGMVIFGVHAIKSFTSVDKAVVISEVHTNTVTRLPAFNVKGDNNIFNGDIFCGDFGMTDGRLPYNNHRIFTLEQEAVAYTDEYNRNKTKQKTLCT